MIKKKFTISNKGDYNATFFSNNKIIFDIQCAVFLGVDTKLINEVVINNPEKFPEGYIINFSLEEWDMIGLNIGKFLSINENNKPQLAFSFKGFYVLSNLLNSKNVIAMNNEIIETFSHLMILAETVAAINVTSNSNKQGLLISQSIELYNELLIKCWNFGAKKTLHSSFTTIKK
jgi:hypothetical protein